MTLEEFLTAEADKLKPLDADWPDFRRYAEDTNPDAINGDAWLDNNTTYIWKIGVLAQIDSNKRDHASLFIAHERQPGRFEFIGMLNWNGGENDDIARSIQRYVRLAASADPVLFRI